MAYTPNNPNGQATSANSEPVVLSTEQEAKIDLLATKAKQDLLLTELQLKADLTETQPVSIAGTVAISGALTDTQLRATAVPVSGTFYQATQPVSLATNTPTETNSGAIKTAVELIDDAIYTDGIGTVVKGIAILGQDGTNPQAIKTDANGELQVDVLTLPNVTIGAAIPAGTNNIGDVDVLTLPNITNAGTFAVQDSEKVADNGGFTDGTTKVMPAGFIYDEVAGTALTENDVAAARINVNRATVNTIEDGATRGRYATVSAANALKVDGSAVTQPVSIAATVNTSSAPVTSGGLTTFHLVSAATTNATNLKASAGQVYGWYIYNSNAAARKVAFHNTAGTPTAGASIFFTLVIPPTSGANVEMSNGIAFSTGIAITTVTDLTDAGTTAVDLNDLNINIFYK